MGRPPLRMLLTGLGIRIEFSRTGNRRARKNAEHDPLRDAFFDPARKVALPVLGANYRKTGLFFRPVPRGAKCKVCCEKPGLRPPDSSSAMHLKPEDPEKFTSL